MRKRIGFISFLYQLIIATVLIAHQISISTPVPNSLTVGLILAYGLADVWFGLSISYKATCMATGRKSNWGFWACAIFVLTAITYVIATNPSPTAPDSVIGLILGISMFVLFKIDLIDSAIQKYCK